MAFQAGVPRTEARTGAVTLIQRIGSAAILNIHRYRPWLDGVYQTTSEAGESEPALHEAPQPTTAQLTTLLDKIIKRFLKLLTQAGQLIEEAGMVYLANTDPDNVLSEGYRSQNLFPNWRKRNRLRYRAHYCCRAK